jgi:hypothetical protein
MEPAPGLVLRVSGRYALSAEAGHTYAAVEGIRLRPDELDDAVAEVAAFLATSGTRRASWWLTERSTPGDLEEQLLARGLTRSDADYLHAAMVLTTPPPAAAIEARPVATFDEFVEARRVGIAAFGDTATPAPTKAELAAEYERDLQPLFAAWVDGRIASVGRAIFTHAGAYLMGGATAEWGGGGGGGAGGGRGRRGGRAGAPPRWDAAVERGTPALAVGAGSMSRPILARLGFEQVLQFRRLEQLLRA